MGGARIANETEMASARPVRWAPFASGRAQFTVDTGELEDAKTALGEALDQVGQLKARLEEIEREQELRQKESHDLGFREGEARGREQAAAELRPVVERMNRSVADIATVRHRLRREAEADLVRLAIVIARHILNREVNVDAGGLETVVRAALDRISLSELVKVRVHPSQAPAITRQLEQQGIAGVTVETVPDFAEGALIVETTRGGVDASIATQLKEIERGLASRLG